MKAAGIPSIINFGWSQ